MYLASHTKANVFAWAVPLYIVLGHSARCTAYKERLLYSNWSRVVRGRADLRLTGRGPAAFTTRSTAMVTLTVFAAAATVSTMTNTGLATERTDGRVRRLASWSVGRQLALTRYCLPPKSTKEREGDPGRDPVTQPVKGRSDIGYKGWGG